MQERFTNMADTRLKDRSLFDPEIMRPAIWESFRKLAPQHVIKNPVMFVVEIGSVLTTLILLRDLIAPTAGSQPLWFTFNVNQSGCDPAVGAIKSRSKIKVVSTLPISTTNMTGFLITCCGASLRKLSQIAGLMISGSNNERSFKRVSAMLVNLSCIGQEMFDDRT